MFFNSHPHKEDDLVRKDSKKQGSIFNSHPHKEDDDLPLNLFPFFCFSTHILTRRMTICGKCGSGYQVFQLTSSQGGWPVSVSLSYSMQFFNSHPHKEDDFLKHSSMGIMDFSTHILTRRMTDSDFICISNRFFSTHILTRRMTELSELEALLEIFQLTSSQGGWL